MSRTRAALKALDEENRKLKQLLAAAVGAQARRSLTGAVLARLISASHDAAVHCPPIHPQVALDERPEQHGREVIHADRRERAVQPCDGRPDRVADEGVSLPHSLCNSAITFAASAKAVLAAGTPA